MHMSRHVHWRTLAITFFAILLGVSVSNATAEDLPQRGVLLSAEEVQALRVAYGELDRVLASEERPGDFLGDPKDPALYKAEISRTPTGFRVSFIPPASERDSRGGNWEVFVALPNFAVDRTVFSK